MIVGIGSDIVNINRIEKTINKFGNKFINRCFSKVEILKSENRLNKVASYAKRFAAKEAFSKALGTGFSKGVFFKDISVENNKLGKPMLKLNGNAEKILKQLVPKNKYPIVNLTITDENQLAYAMVIISFD
tara:strand:+ start:738 stop:1130 length:393 start_codon:yes stop_codon:yes gene_type:complete